MKAIIVGGGVGGLVTALMLHMRGIDCEVFEQADSIRELGVGINTLPHAIKELKELGLLERLDAVAIRTYELFYLNRFGQEIWRDRLFPNEGPPAWDGLMLWRGATDWPQCLTGRSMMIAGGLEAKFVLYPIAAGTAPDRRLTNWAVVARVSDGATPPPRKEDWSRSGRWEDLGPHLKRFRIPYCDVTHLIEATGEFWEYPMCDRDPLPRWSHGRVTLLGDAAHPMYPVGSNGASQAILDARCLADRLRSAEHVVHALWMYEQERLPMTAQIVRMNRKGGPEGVIDAVEARAPDGFTSIDDVLSFEERQAIVRGYASTAGFAREQVNKAA